MPAIQQEQKAPESEKAAARSARAVGESPSPSPLLPLEAMTPQSLLGLQGAAGNGAVAALLERRAPPPVEAAVAPDSEAPLEPAVQLETEAPAVVEQAESAETSAESLDLHQKVSAAEVSPGAQQLIQQAGAAHDESQMQLRTMIDTSSDRIEKAVGTEHANLDAAAAAHTSSVKGAFASARAAVTSAASAHKATARESHQAQAARLQAWKVRSGTAAQTAAASRATRARTMGSTHATQAEQDADKAAADMQTEVAAKAKEARAIGTRKAQAPGASEEVRAVKAKVAREISEDTAGKIQAGLGQADQQLRDQGHQLAGSLAQQANQVVDQLDAQVPAILKQVDNVHQTAQQSLDTGLTTSADAITRLHQTAAKSMSGLETQAVSQVQGQVRKHKQQLTAAGKQAVQQLRKRGRAASAAGSKALGQVSNLAAGSQIGPEQAASLGDETAAQFRQAFGAAGSAAMQTADSMASGFAEGGTKLTSGIGTAATQAKSHTDSQVSAVHKQLGDVVQQHATQTSSVASNAMTAGDTTVAQVGTDLDAHLDKAQTSFGDVLASFGSQLQTNVAASASNAQQPVSTLDARIQTAQEKAEADAKKGWWAKQWGDIKEMVTSPAFLTGLVIGLLVAAVIILSAGTATPFVLMAAAVAGGMAAGAASTMVSNAQKGEDILQMNVLTNALIGGAAGAVAAGIVLFGGGVVAGLGLTGAEAAIGGFIVLEVAAVGSTIFANVLTGGWKNWDRGIIAAMLLAPVIGRLVKALGLDPAGLLEEQPGGKKPPVDENLQGQEEQLKTPGGRLEVAKAGLFESIDPANVPEGWTIVDGPIVIDGELRVVRTTFTGPNGQSGWIERAWNPTTGEFVMKNAFLGDAPSWIQNEVPMIEGKGTPTQTYMTLRIMKILGVGFGEPVTARMSTIQNIEAIMQLEQQVRAGVPQDQAVMNTESVKYGKTNIQQGGNQIDSAHVEGGQRTPIGDLLDHYETHGNPGGPKDPAVVAANDALLKKYGFGRTDEMLWDYDIELKLRGAK